MIFEDDEKDNNEFDASINSDDTDGISWDDLLNEGEESNLVQNYNENIEPEIRDVAQDVQPIELNEGLEGIAGDNASNDAAIESELDGLANLDMLEDQNDEPIVEESSASRSMDEVISYDNTNDTQTEINYSQDNSANVRADNETDFDKIDLDNFGRAQEAPSVAPERNPDIIGIASLNNAESEEMADNNPPFGMQPDAVQQKNSSSSAPVILGVLVALILIAIIAGGFLVLKNGGIESLTSMFTGSNNGNQEYIDTPSDMGFEDMGVNNEGANIPNDVNQEPQQVPQNINNTEAQNNNPASSGVNTQSAAKPQPKDEKVVVSVTKTGRANPFAPTGNISAAGYTIPTLGNLAPPSDLAQDEELGKLVDIVCTGILYDNVKPSAIITVGGIDYFVQKGDRVDKFIVSAITPTSVVIRNGSNSYVATIGQEFDVAGSSPGKMNYVYNGKSKPVTRQYHSPSEIEVKVKQD